MPIRQRIISNNWIALEKLIVMYEWEKQEIKSEQYLNKRYGDIASFVRHGGVDSTAPDILVMRGTQNIFNIEVKHTPSQAGQFALQYDDHKKMYRYSDKNRLSEIPAAKRISFKANEIITSKILRNKQESKILDVEKDASMYLRYLYSSKNIKFLICDENIIMPVSKISKYFIIETFVGMRRSGTADAGTRNDDILNLLKSIFPELKCICDGKKIFVVDDCCKVENWRFRLGLYEYSFVKKQDKLFELRKQSNTFSYTVYFQLNLRSGKRGIRQQTLKNYIMSYELSEK